MAGRREGGAAVVWCGWRSGGVALATVLAFAGCSSVSRAPARDSDGIYHQVRPGENLYRIGKAYGVSHDELARVNDVADPNRVEIGQRLFIPGGRRVLPVGVITPRHAVVETSDVRDFPRGEGIFIWPLASGTLTSTFGPRGQGFHDGIDLGAPPGTPIRAARDGVVIYSDSLRGYGNVVIVEHSGGYATVYAHNRENLVRAGERVRQGQLVANLGSSGRTSGPNLHFEIRKDNLARNPIYFLPSQTAQRAKDGPT